MNRWACLHDLNNYFRKKDLLGGLTIPELKLLRYNIGIPDAFGDGGNIEPVVIKHNDLYELCKTNKLITGARYKITDFKTIYNSNNEVWGDSINPSTPYTLIVIANTTSILDPRVTIIEHPDWIVEYNVTPTLLNTGDYNKGNITYLKDSNGNSAYYDFKNIKFNKDGKAYYTFSDIRNSIIIDSSELSNTKNNTLDKNCYNNIFMGDTYNNIIQPNCSNNIFYKGCHNSIIGWDSVNNIFKEPVRYLLGSLYNKNFIEGDTTLSTTISKRVLKVNEVDIVSFLDPITYSYLVIII